MVAPTIAPSLVGSLDKLIGFPYGCVEQTTSRFFPTVVFAHAADQLGLPKPKLAAQVPDIVRESYKRLGDMQHEDGAGGWWENDTSDTYMTDSVLKHIDQPGI